jgi:hypothetical protein
MFCFVVLSSDVAWNFNRDAQIPHDQAVLKMPSTFHCDFEGGGWASGRLFLLVEKGLFSFYIIQRTTPWRQIKQRTVGHVWYSEMLRLALLFGEIEIFFTTYCAVIHIWVTLSNFAVHLFT